MKQLICNRKPDVLRQLAKFVCSLRIAVQLDWSFVGVFNRRLDEKFVGVLRQWSADWKARRG